MDSGVVVAIALAVISLIGTVIGGIMNRRKIGAEATKASAEARSIDADADQTSVETARGLVSTLREELKVERQARKDDKKEFNEQLEQIRADMRASLAERDTAITKAEAQIDELIANEEVLTNFVHTAFVWFAQAQEAAKGKVELPPPPRSPLSDPSAKRRRPRPQ